MSISKNKYDTCLNCSHFKENDPIEGDYCLFKKTRIFVPIGCKDIDRIEEEERCCDCNEVFSKCGCAPPDGYEPSDYQKMRWNELTPFERGKR